MRRPDLDIKLTDGQGFMVEDKEYKEYLSVAKEPRLVCLFLYYAFFSTLAHLTRGHPVVTTELLTPPAPTIDET